MNKNLEIGERLKQLRRSAKLTQLQLGTAVKMGSQAYGRYELGEVDDIRPDYIAAWAKMLGVPPSAIDPDFDTFGEDAKLAAELVQHMSELGRRHAINVLKSILDFDRDTR